MFIRLLIRFSWKLKDKTEPCFPFLPSLPSLPSFLEGKTCRLSGGTPGNPAPLVTVYEEYVFKSSNQTHYSNHLVASLMTYILLVSFSILNAHS